jgi:hypothetical protein
MFSYRKTIISILIILLTFSLFGCGKVEDNSLNKLVESFNNENLDFKLYYIGKNENLLNLNVTYIDHISNIPFNNHKKNQFIVVNNLDGLLSFDLESLIDLKESIETYNYSFYYFGTTHIDLFFQSGLFMNEIMDPSSLSFGYVKDGNKFINVMGTWDQTANEVILINELIFLELLLYEFKFQISVNS